MMFLHPKTYVEVTDIYIISFYRSCLHYEYTDFTYDRVNVVKRLPVYGIIGECNGNGV